MNGEPRTQDEYDKRQTEAAYRVLVDVGQVLAAFDDCLVLIGGWVPDLLLPNAQDPHVGSIDVDFALDAQKLNDGRYADLVGQLLNTRRYRPGRKPFQLVADVDLRDGGAPVQVEVEFLAPKEVKLEKNKPKLLKGFRVLQADACGTAFREPVQIQIEGRTIHGARDKVRIRVASLVDFLVMKAHALEGRDKPKDSYDLCYCLDHYPGGIEELAAAWRRRTGDGDVRRAIEILHDKFTSPENFGPAQVVEFFNSANVDARAMQARRAFELVQKLLRLI
ncbi:MAG TPA: nucleotidyl transferase AbiEii/AbiGii toxin family protein [Terriglobia bacterium]|nr:nucleotidyl transferase AbiEii/AbiGii toxin family protein [Terriglobia bacterium]